MKDMINGDLITEKNFVRIYKLLNKPVKTTKSSKPETKGLIALFSDYIERYKEITKYNGEAVQNFDQIATYQGEIIFTNFWVDIQEHFVQKLKKFTSTLIVKNQKIFCPVDVPKSTWIKNLQSLNRKVQKYLIENETDVSDLSEVDLNIFNEIKQILPSTIEKNSIYYDSVCNVEKYFKPYYKLCLLYEKYRIGRFNVFPISTSTIPRHVFIDTSILANFVLGLGTKITTKEISVNENRDEIWNSVFNLRKKPFNERSGMVFCGNIRTDGVSISILLQDKISLEKKREKFNKRKKPNEEKPTSDKKVKISTTKAKKKQVKQIQQVDKNDIDELLGEKSEYFQKNLSEIKDNRIYIDPNKHLLYCLGSNGNKLRYTQMQRRKETNSKRYELLRRNLAQEAGILPKTNPKVKRDVHSEQTKRTDQNLKIPSRTILDPVGYDIYLRYYFDVFKRDEEFYRQDIFRKLRFNSFINTQKSESNFIKRTRETFGDVEDTTVLIGDWSRTSLKYQNPTKGKGFRKMFRAAGYKVFLVNEYLTSSICPHCKKKSLEKFLFREHPNPYSEEDTQIVHGLLRCQSEICQQQVKNVLVNRLWNRDDVATLNLKYVVEHTFEFGDRPECLSRSNN